MQIMFMNITEDNGGSGKLGLIQVTNKEKIGMLKIDEL